MRPPHHRQFIHTFLALGKVFFRITSPERAINGFCRPFRVCVLTEQKTPRACALGYCLTPLRGFEQQRLRAASRLILTPLTSGVLSVYF